MKKLFIPPIFLFISLLLMVLSYFVLPSLHFIPFPYNCIGILISFLGIVLMGKTRDLLKKHQTPISITMSSALIQEGVFAKTRNPMYVGMFLLLLGIGFCFGNLIAILIPIVFLGLIHFVFVKMEEKLLFDKFGQIYLDYKSRVKRWV